MTALWVAAFATPLVAALVLALAPFVPSSADLRTTVCRFAWVAAAPVLVLAITGEGSARHVEWLLVGTHLELDHLGRPLTAMAAVLYGLALAYVPRSGTPRAPALAALLLVCLVGNVGVFLAADLVTFYLAFTVMSFVGYALVVHTRSGSALRAGRIYLVMTVLGEAAVLTALLLIAAAGGTDLADAPAIVAEHAHRDVVILLLLAGFGIKAGTAPLHVWLPLAHPAAPVPASAVLSGAMVKAGLVGWLRFLPLGEGAGLAGWGTIFVLLALLGGFLAVPVGLLQDDPKVILAYSTISQLGFLAVLVGVALAEPGLAPACVAAAVVYAVHHGIAKGVLFLGVGVWDRERVPRALVVATLGVAGLAVIGAPVTSGYVAKYAAKEAVGDAVFPATGGVLLGEVLPWVAVGSTLLLARFAVVLWGREREAEAAGPGRGPLWGPAWSPVWTAAAVLAIVPVWLVATRYPQEVSVPGLADPGVLAAQSWPLLLGVVLALAVASAARRDRWHDSRIAHPHGDLVPPGDVVALEERVVRASWAHLAGVAARAAAAGARVRAQASALPSPAPVAEWLRRRWDSWVGSGVTLLLILALATVLATAAGGAR